MLINLIEELNQLLFSLMDAISGFSGLIERISDMFWIVMTKAMSSHLGDPCKMDTEGKEHY